MTRPINRTSNEVKDLLDPVAQNITNTLGQQTDEELIYQTADAFESDLEAILQDLGIDPEAASWRFQLRLAGRR